MFEIGKEATMEFHCGGMVSFEEIEVVDLDDDVVYLDRGNGCEDAWMFNIKTGKCLNDNNFLGAFRKLVV